MALKRNFGFGAAPASLWLVTAPDQASSTRVCSLVLGYTAAVGSGEGWHPNGWRGPVAQDATFLVALNQSTSGGLAARPLTRRLGSGGTRRMTLKHCIGEYEQRSAPTPKLFAMWWDGEAEKIDSTRSATEGHVGPRGAGTFSLVVEAYNRRLQASGRRGARDSAVAGLGCGCLALGGGGSTLMRAQLCGAMSVSVS